MIPLWDLEGSALQALERARPQMLSATKRLQNRHYWGHLVTECDGWVFRWLIRGGEFAGIKSMATPSGLVYYCLEQAPAVAQWEL